MWFHISKVYLGKSKLLLPRVPDCCYNNDTCKYEEGNIPRICVSDSLFYCLKAIMGVDRPDMGFFKKYFTENPCVYYTEEIPYTPPNCLDFRDNHEQWFITETKFFYLARINMYKLFKDRIIEPTSKKEIKYIKNDKIFIAEHIQQKFIQKLEIKLL